MTGPAGQKQNSEKVQSESNPGGKEDKASRSRGRSRTKKVSCISRLKVISSTIFQIFNEMTKLNIKRILQKTKRHLPEDQPRDWSLDQETGESTTKKLKRRKKEFHSKSEVC